MGLHHGLHGLHRLFGAGVREAGVELEEGAPSLHGSLGSQGTQRSQESPGSQQVWFGLDKVYTLLFFIRTSKILPGLTCS